MNSNNNDIKEVSLNREQLLNAVAMHLEGLPFYRNKEIYDLEIEGLYKTPAIPIKFKLREVNQ